MDTGDTLKDTGRRVDDNWASSILMWPVSRGVDFGKQIWLAVHDKTEHEEGSYLRLIDICITQL